MKILFIGDIPNWIIDYNMSQFILRNPDIQFTVKYNGFPIEEFINTHHTYDLIHFHSWGEVHRYTPTLRKEPQKYNNILITVRSHRYAGYVAEFCSLCKQVFTVNYKLLDEFKVYNPICIPNGVDVDMFKPDKPFVVGYSGKSDDYKGFPLIQQACDELAVEFNPITGALPRSQLPEYYNSLSAYVCASLAEGFSTGVMEALACNTPVVTTDVGIPSRFNIIKVPRTVEGIVSGLQKLYTRPYIESEYTWDAVSKLQRDQWERIVNEIS